MKKSKSRSKQKKEPVVSKPSPKATKSKPSPSKLIPPQPPIQQIQQIQQMNSLPRRSNMFGVPEQGPRQKLWQKWQDQPIDYKQPVKLQKMVEKGPVSEYDVNKNLQIYLKCRYDNIKCSAEAQKIPVVFNIHTEQMAMETRRQPFDLICVLDHSGSMAGQKIKLLRDTLKNLLEQLDENDRICLIEFDDRADMMCPLVRGTPQNKVKLLSVIDRLNDRGGTNIAQGMKLAFNTIKNRKFRNAITSVFLLTDGLDGGAIIGTKNVLASAQITDPFTINCFGFGKDHDGTLMTTISDMKDGAFFYIQKLQVIDQAFASALGGLMSVVAQDIEIQLLNMATGMYKGIEIGKTYGQIWDKVGVTNGIRTKLIQLNSGKDKGFIFDLNIPPFPEVKHLKQKLLVISAKISFKDREMKHTFQKTADLIIHLFGSEDECQVNQDGEVMENYYRVVGADAIQQAVALADFGNYQQGQHKLQSVFQQISKNKVINQAKMQSFKTQIKQSIRNCTKVEYASKKNNMLCMNKAMKCQKPGGFDPTSMNMQEMFMVQKTKSKKA